MKKKEIRNILSGFDKTELPSKGRILSACPEAVGEAQIRRSVRKRNIIILAVVVSAVLVLVGCAAEVKEYREAVAFFEEYSLSVGDLSRSEIKKVYRDIKTEKFVFEKTAEVLLRTVDGYDLNGNEPTPEELKAVWDNLGAPEDDIYTWYYIDNEIVVDGITQSGEMMFEKRIDGEAVWSTRIDLRDSFVEGYSIISDTYIAVYGVDGRNIDGRKSAGFIDFLNENNGERLWRYVFDDYKFFSIAEILQSGDEIVIFGRGDLESFVFTRMDISGAVTYQKITEIGNMGIWDVATFGDGYLVQLGGYQQSEKLVKVSSKGEISESFSYSSEDTAYFIKDMMEYGGMIYLSTYAVPKNGRDIQTSHDEIGAVLEKIWNVSPGEADSGEMSNYGIFMNVENLTENLRNNYTAVLLVCDTETGIPGEFYSVKGSVCGELSLNENGEMLWETEYISDSYYSPTTSSFSIGGACYVYRHTFDRDGELVSSEKTGEVSSFRR